MAKKIPRITRLHSAQRLGKNMFGERKDPYYLLNDVLEVYTRNIRMFFSSFANRLLTGKTPHNVAKTIDVDMPELNMIENDYPLVICHIAIENGHL